MFRRLRPIHALAVPALLAVAVVSGGTSQAQLVPRLGGQAVYDADRDITFVSDANLPRTMPLGVPGIGADGMMNWLTANDWIAALNDAGYLEFSDWRLPTARRDGGIACYSPADCADGELHHLWVELGGPDVEGGAGDITGSSDPDLALFHDFPDDLYKFYWESTIASRGRAWVFALGAYGNRHRVYSRDAVDFVFAWPVRDGDVLFEAKDERFPDPRDPSVIEWRDAPGVDRFQVARSDSPGFPAGCARWDAAAPWTSDPDLPAPGSAFFYVVRPLAPSAGSWGKGSSGIERAGGCL
ncbi:MAG: hypothetical protein Kow0062_10570 [Acidobacteriota bacterium]